MYKYVPTGMYQKWGTLQCHAEPCSASQQKTREAQVIPDHLVLQPSRLEVEGFNIIILILGGFSSFIILICWEHSHN